LDLNTDVFPGLFSGNCRGQQAEREIFASDPEFRVLLACCSIRAADAAASGLAFLAAQVPLYHVVRVYRLRGDFWGGVRNDERAAF
jgi:hypothetical protein